MTERGDDRGKAYPRPGDPLRVEFVCTGNICRSPFAEGAAIALGHPPEFVGSSGVWAQEGRSCPQEAVDAARWFGVDLRPHRARPATGARLRRADRVVPMECAQERDIRRMLPTPWAGRVTLLGAFLSVPKDEIQDPFGCDPWTYEWVYRTIWDAVGLLLAGLRPPA